ncbi:MAG: hypothetical protein HYY40_12600 [Bacteroidetes bacterium]|nr:hypothetical protein [Bacteroidota bacterium]
MLSPDNININGLWIGKELTETEQLTIRSFRANGHRFHLWLYDQIENIPGETVVHDASEVIPRDRVFRYPRESPIRWGKGSYGGFSDIFRYKFLYEKGGWWVDMDITCLKPFDFQGEYFFRDHWKFNVVGNAMKCPSGSELMKRCYEDAVKEVTAANTSWHKPIEILNRHIKPLGLLKYRHRKLFNDDHSFKLKKFFTGNVPFPEQWYGIHWVNSAGKINWKPGSTFHELLMRYEVISRYDKPTF